MSSRARFPALGPAALVVLVAGLWQAWVLRLPFRHDDLLLIDSASEWLASAPGGGEELRFWGIFRPTFWALIALERFAFPEPLRATSFYAVALALHCGIAWLVLRLGQVFFTPKAAIAGALVFAIVVSGIQAIAWIAAGGDALATFSSMLGLLCALKIRSVDAAALSAGLCAALAVGAKESGLVWIPLIAIAVLRRSAPIARFKTAALLLALPAALLVVRRLYLGSWVPYYLSPTAGAMEVGLPRMTNPAIWLDLFVQLLVPWNLSPEAVGTRAVAARLGILAGLDLRAVQGIVAALLAVILLAPPLMTHRGRRLLWILAALVVIALPAAWAWVPASGTWQSRNSYAVTVPLAFLAALSAEGIGALWRSRAGLRPLLGALVVISGLLIIDSWQHTVAYHGLVGRAIESRVASLESMKRELPPETVFLVEDPQIVFAEQHLLGPYIEQQCARPFRATDLRVVLAAHLPAIVEAAMLISMAEPVQVATVQNHRYVASRPLAAAMPDSLPALRRVDSGTRATAYVPELPVSPRAVYGIQCFWRFRILCGLRG